MNKNLFNQNIILIPLIAIFFLILTGSNNFSNNFKISKALNSEMSTKDANEELLIWVTFRDKGNNVNELLAHPERFLTDRAIKRRMKVKPANALVDYSDIPLEQSYISDLSRLRLKVKNRSKWFNSVK